MRFGNQKRGVASTLLMGAVLAACGGGGGGESSSGGSSNTGPTGGSETLRPSSTYAQRCAPGNSQAASPRNGSLTIEKQWIRAYFDENYLWNSQVPTVDPASSAYAGTDVSAALENHFDALRTPQRTSTGARLDRFSFMMPSSDWQALAGSAENVGYGLEWAMASKTVPRQIRVAHVEAGGLAQSYGIRRGWELVSVDGISADASDGAGVDAINEALYPSSRGAFHNFIFRRVDGSTAYASMYSGISAKSPVLLSEVITASGGYLYIASELAYMIAGPGKINGRAFERLKYNARRAADDQTTPFYDTSCYLNSSNRCNGKTALPTLNLSRVFVLTQSGTCSASESIINGLLGIDLQVIQIGGTTCGKRYGFTAAGSNALSSGSTVQGCLVDDDFTRALSDPAEGMLAAALNCRSTGRCPPPPLAKAQTARQGEGGGLALQLRRHPALSNRIAGGRH